MQLPGRESRWNEPPYRRLDALVAKLADVIAPLAAQPLAIFGHSMGALVGFEVARRLRNQYGLTPAHLFASAHRAPHLPDRRAPLRHLSDDAFVQAVCERYGGIPQAVLESAELMSLVLPGLRADFELLETVAFVPDAPLECPVTVLGGLDDPNVSEADLEAWRPHTTGPFTIAMFEGAHFFVQSARADVQTTIADALCLAERHAIC